MKRFLVKLIVSIVIVIVLCMIMVELFPIIMPLRWAKIRPSLTCGADLSISPVIQDGNFYAGDQLTLIGISQCPAGVQMRFTSQSVPYPEDVLLESYVLDGTVEYTVRPGEQKICFVVTKTLEVWDPEAGAGECITILGL